MMFRLVRIQKLLLGLTTVVAVGASLTGATLPLGVVMGGTAAWLDFVVIRELAALMLARKPSPAHVIPIAILKSVLLIALPASALFLPRSLVDGVSFAVGVTTLPAAIVMDALMPSSENAAEREA
jgi:hypothetical protein